MVVLFTGEYIEVVGIKNLLDSFGIESYLSNENMSVIKPSLMNAGGFNPVSLYVNEEKIMEAKKILEDFNKGVYGLDY